MSLQLTLVLALCLAALGVFSGWRGARPPDPLKGARLTPWRLIMLFSAAGLILMLVHVVNLLGMTTGRS